MNIEVMVFQDLSYGDGWNPGLSPSRSGRPIVPHTRQSLSASICPLPCCCTCNKRVPRPRQWITPRILSPGNPLWNFDFPAAPYASRASALSTFPVNVKNVLQRCSQRTVLLFPPQNGHYLLHSSDVFRAPPGLRRNPPKGPARTFPAYCRLTSPIRLLPLQACVSSPQLPAREEASPAVQTPGRLQSNSPLCSSLFNTNRQALTMRPSNGKKSF